VTDDELLAGFEACTLAEFHHADHVRVAWLYLRRFAVALQRFAAANGAPQKYDDALTCRYLALIAGQMRGETSFDDFAAANPDLLVWKKPAYEELR
jgi:hypothetical protein